MINIIECIKYLHQYNLCLNLIYLNKDYKFYVQTYFNPRNFIRPKKNDINNNKKTHERVKTITTNSWYDMNQELISGHEANEHKIIFVPNNEQEMFISEMMDISILAYNWPIDIIDKKRTTNNILDHTILNEIDANNLKIDFMQNFINDQIDDNEIKNYVIYETIAKVIYKLRMMMRNILEGRAQVLELKSQK